MKMMQKSLLALAIIATTALNVHAASTADIKVIGSIEPGTCTPTLAGGGTIDYGTMSPSVLNATGYTALPANDINFTINCTAASKVAIKALNKRPDTSPSGRDVFSGGGADITGITLLGVSGLNRVAGLGMQDKAKIGGYVVRINSASLQADSTAVDTLLSRNSGSTWAAAGKETDMFGGISTARYYSVAAKGQTSPVAFTTLTGKFDVQAFINDRKNLDLTNIVNLDGLTTLELVYIP
ncbi:DUF1120 domain-containing protein [Pantoea sp. S61]|uniref:DUF1120 domain-containing protein n=1 Tax=Pantoea sp. S61 TaxID=2767442 RepID=UPI00190D74FE|nr:DUF1120 domain-containing protein [Pantoea sp. S61]MBK0126283.1 DUF1120 domain-containing protein [Pantoea sp. S61]